MSALRGEKITEPVEKRGASRFLMVSYLLMAIGTVIVTISVAVTSGTRTAWIGHAITAIFGLLLLVIIILTGAKQGGRIFRGNRFPVYHLHHAASIWFSIVVTATFILGLLVTLHHGEPVLRSLHGTLGLTITVLAFIQLVPSFIITKRTSIRIIHRITGYLILIVFSIQIFSGLRITGFL